MEHASQKHICNNNFVLLPTLLLSGIVSCEKKNEYVSGDYLFFPIHYGMP